MRIQQPHVAGGGAPVHHLLHSHPLPLPIPPREALNHGAVPRDRCLHHLLGNSCRQQRRRQTPRQGTKIQRLQAVALCNDTSCEIPITNGVKQGVMDVSDVSHLEITPLNLLPSSRGHLFQ